MKSVRTLLSYAYFALWIPLLLQTNALAYIDPSTTAMITQIVAGVFISLGLAFGIFRQKIILFFKDLKVKRMQKKIEKEQESKEQRGTDS